VSGGLAVGVGVGIATDELLRLARAADAVSVQCGDIVRRVPALRTGQYPAVDADLWQLEGSTRRAAEHLGDIAASLRTAATLYDVGEQAVARAIESIAAQAAAAAGLLVSRLGVVLVPGLLGAAAVGAIGWVLAPAAARDEVLDGAARLLSDPRAVEALRAALSLVDDALLGTLGFPPSIVAALGETGAGLSGIDSAAGLVAGLAAIAGVQGLAPVLIDRVGGDARRGGERQEVSPPGSLAERVARIPDADAPIRIERYTMPDGSEHVEVYIAGTDAHAPLGGEQPWDMASNIALVAELDASSLQAVRAALAAEGVTAQTSIVFTGYSQGGAIAAQLAESGDYATAGLVTIGAPSGGMPITGSYPAVVIEHRDDLVPVLSGLRRDTTAVVVRADALEAGSSPGGVLPAHDRDRYAATAAAADEHGSAVLQAAVAALPAPSGAGVAVSYTAARIPKPAAN
jgi:hypothetical protein